MSQAVSVLTHNPHNGIFQRLVGRRPNDDALMALCRRFFDQDRSNMRLFAKYGQDDPPAALQAAALYAMDDLKAQIAATPAHTRLGLCEKAIVLVTELDDLGDDLSDCADLIRSVCEDISTLGA